MLNNPQDIKNDDENERNYKNEVKRRKQTISSLNIKIYNFGEKYWYFSLFKMKMTRVGK